MTIIERRAVSPRGRTARYILGFVLLVIIKVVAGVVIHAAVTAEPLAFTTAHAPDGQRPGQGSLVAGGHW